MSIINPDASPDKTGHLTHPSNPVEDLSCPLILATGESTPHQDFECGCSATIPPGSRIFFMKFAAISMIVGGIIVYGLYKLFEYLGWM